MDIEKENVVQAVVIMDTFNNNLIPITNDKPLALCKVAGVPLIDYMLESLAHGGVGEAVLFCCRFGVLIKEHIRKCIERRAPWTMVMTTKVMMSDACRTMGDIMRELDRAETVKGYFILTGINTITNIPLSSLLEKHIQMCKKDKGAAMTLVFKEVAWDHPLIRSDKTVLLTVDADTNKVIVHKKYKTKNKDKKVTIPLETFLQHSEGKSYHHLADANIALCSPSVLPLFSDNFDFQSRDDFIHGILINEEILASSLYYTLLKSQQYAAAVTNWKTYQIVSNDIMHLWAHPLSIETGSFLQNQFNLTFDHNFRSKSSVLSRSCELLGNVLIGAKTKINDNTVLSNAVVGEYCDIGSNVTITGSHIMNNVVIKENCKIINSFVDDNCVIEENCTLENGTMIGSGVTIKCNSQMNGNIIEAKNENVEIFNDSGDSDSYKNQTEHSRTKSTSESGTDWENESSGSETDDFVGFNESWSDSDTCYSTDSSESSLHCSPVPEDTNIFLQEVIDSLARGYDDKLVCDNLILEINSSRYAYNIQLNEVNFFVVRAILSLPVITESTKVLSTIKDVLKYFRPVLANYIKTKSSIMDCLKAVEESCIKCDWLHGKAGQLIHLLYDAEVVDEECLLEWHQDLVQEESPLLTEISVVKFFEWLQEASEESESD